MIHSRMLFFLGSRGRRQHPIPVSTPRVQVATDPNRTGCGVIGTLVSMLWVGGKFFCKMFKLFLHMTDNGIHAAVRIIKLLHAELDGP